MNPLSRIRLLIAQHRYDMAERELRSLLSQDPQNGDAHALLAICLLHDQQRQREATEHAEQAIGLQPDDPIGHYALAVSLLQRNRPEQAERAIGEALRLDPYDADSFAVLARCYLSQDRHQDALEAARQGLAADADHVDCGNMRSIALERLGRGDEAIASASETLRRDPDDPMSHAAFGLTLLNSQRYDEAQVAFRESLRLDPGNEMARQGMIAALNNRSIIFRLVYRFYVALSRLNNKAAFALIFGAWLLMQVLSRLSVTYPALGPLINPILFLYVLFVVLTWIANPLFNTFLRFHAFGQHLLDRRQRWASNLIAPCLALAIFGFLVGLGRGSVLIGLVAAAYWVAMAIPVAATFAMPTAGRRLLVAVAAVVIGLLPVIGIARSAPVASLDPFFESLQMFAFGLLGIQIASSLIAVTPVRT